MPSACGLSVTHTLSVSLYLFLAGSGPSRPRLPARSHAARLRLPPLSTATRTLPPSSHVAHNERAYTYCCRLVWSFSGWPRTVLKLASGPLTVSVDLVESAPVEPWRFPSELLLLRRVIPPLRSPPASPWETDSLGSRRTHSVRGGRARSRWFLLTRSCGFGDGHQNQSSAEQGRAEQSTAQHSTAQQWSLAMAVDRADGMVAGHGVDDPACRLSPGSRSSFPHTFCRLSRSARKSAGPALCDFPSRRARGR